MNENVVQVAQEEKLLSSLGLCVRAGRVIFGVPMTCDAMRWGGSNKTVLVLEAADTSENTHKRLQDKCAYYGVKHIRLSLGGDSLAAATGKSFFLGAVAVTDAGMAGLIEKYL